MGFRYRAKKPLPTIASLSDGSWIEQTTPDGIIYREFFATSGWQTGLTTITEIWSGRSQEEVDHHFLDRRTTSA